jgi:hypothetical protein
MQLNLKFRVTVYTVILRKYIHWSCHKSRQTYLIMGDEEVDAINNALYGVEYLDDSE